MDKFQQMINMMNADEQDAPQSRVLSLGPVIADGDAVDRKDPDSVGTDRLSDLVFGRKLDLWTQWS